MAQRGGQVQRRDVLRGIGGGALAAALGSMGLRPGRVVGQEQREAGAGKGPLYTPCTKPAKVTLIKGNDRREIVFATLKNIEDEVMASIGRKKRILVKPNFVSTTRPLAASHVDEVRGILDFFKPRFQGEIVIGESAAGRGGTFEGYQNFGYLPLEKEYGVKLVDLNAQPWVYRYVFGKDHNPIPIRIISTFLDRDTYIVSAAKMKTHDRAITTLALKNVLIGAPLNDGKRNDKGLTHQAYNFTPKETLHFNMFHLAQEIWPDLGIIDGFEAMEGNGPVSGTPVDAKVALASLDSLALDIVATKIMGFDPMKVPYVQPMIDAGMGQGDPAKMQVVGTPVEQCQFKFKANEKIVEAFGLG
ncbi:MAG: DUF362 domain-containing protein [Planctomycetes bacterium]|nr:DUF362 domain-containing protein [Planctomycetota bacterium]